VGPDRNKHLRNIAIVVLLALAAWQLPGGGTAVGTINNVLGLIFAGGIVFFGYRLYMEHRTTLFGLEDRLRGLFYGSLVLLALALIGTSRLFDEGGVGVLIWLALIGAAVYGGFTVYRASREY
jgi:TRAP-type C4-dicarboxylate transport system permease small subunit